MRDLLARIPAGRFAEPDEIAGAAVFLASPAASYVTGSVLVGGRRLARPLGSAMPETFDIAGHRRRHFRREPRRAARAARARRRARGGGASRHAGDRPLRGASRRGLRNARDPPADDAQPRLLRDSARRIFRGSAVPPPCGAWSMRRGRGLPRLREEFAVAATMLRRRMAARRTRLPNTLPAAEARRRGGGFLEPNALELDANALLQGFARQVRRQGSADPRRGARPPRRAARSGWLVRRAGIEIACGAHGQRGGRLGRRGCRACGVARRGLQPMRRTAATIGVPDELAALLPRHPFVAPVDESFYFKPETGAIMVSLSEETPSEPCDAYPDDLDVATGARTLPRGDHRAALRGRSRPGRGSERLRRDRLPVVGFDPEVRELLLVCRAGRHRHPDLAGAFGARREAHSRPGHLIADRDRDRRALFR